MKSTRYDPPVPESTYVITLTRREISALIGEFLRLGSTTREIKENYPYIYELWSSISRAEQKVGVADEL